MARLASNARQCWPRPLRRAAAGRATPEPSTAAITSAGGVGVLALVPGWSVGGQVLSNPVRIALVVVCFITLFYLVMTLTRSVSEGG